jgi:hypothetical protein
MRLVGVRGRMEVRSEVELVGIWILDFGFRVCGVKDGRC